MSKKKKSTTPGPAATEPKRVDDKFEFAPLEAALRFLEERRVAYDESTKNYRLRDEASSTWLSLNGNALKRVMKQWMKIGRAHV